MPYGPHITSRLLVENWGDEFIITTNGTWRKATSEKDKALLYNYSPLPELYSKEVDKKYQQPLENDIAPQIKSFIRHKNISCLNKPLLLQYVADLDYRVDGYISLDDVARKSNSFNATDIERYSAHRDFIMDCFTQNNVLNYEIVEYKYQDDFFVLSDHPVYLKSNIFILPITPRVCLVGYSHKMSCKEMNDIHKGFATDRRLLLFHSVKKANMFCVASKNTKSDILDFISYGIYNGWNWDKE